MNEEKLFNIYIKKKEILKDCQDSLFCDNDYDNKYSNFLITYNEILKMHLTIFLDIENNKNNLTIIIDYLCILILLLNIPNNPEEPEETEETEKLKIANKIKIIKDTLNKIENDKKISNTKIIKLKDKITKNDENSKLIKTSNDYESFISPLTSEDSRVTGGTVAPKGGPAPGVAPEGGPAPGDGAATTSTGNVDTSATAIGNGTGADATSTTIKDGFGSGGPGNDIEGDPANIATDTTNGNDDTSANATGNGTGNGFKVPNAQDAHIPGATPSVVVPVPNTTDGNDDNISQKLLEILKMKIMHDILLFNQNDFNFIKTQISAIG